MTCLFRHFFPSRISIFLTANRDRVKNSLYWSIIAHKYRYRDRHRFVHSFGNMPMSILLFIRSVHEASLPMYGHIYRTSSHRIAFDVHECFSLFFYLSTLVWHLRVHEFDQQLNEPSYYYMRTAVRLSKIALVFIRQQRCRVHYCT